MNCARTVKRRLTMHSTGATQRQTAASLAILMLGRGLKWAQSGHAAVQREAMDLVDPMSAFDGSAARSRTRSERQLPARCCHLGKGNPVRIGGVRRPSVE